MKRRLLAFVVVLAAVAASAAPAQEMVFQVDAAQSHVDFTLGDVLHTVHGTFKMKNSAVDFDPQTGAASGAFVVDATTGDSGSTGRDKKMHKDVLESRKYPEIRFAVQQFHGSLPANGTAQVQIAGILTLHGADHPFTATAPVEITNGRASTDVHFEVPYVAWGLKDPSTLFLRVGKTVDIVVHAVGTVSTAAVTASH